MPVSVRLAAATAAVVCVVVCVSLQVSILPRLSVCDLTGDGAITNNGMLSVKEKAEGGANGAYLIPTGSSNVKRLVEGRNAMQLRQLANEAAAKANRLRVIADAMALASRPSRLWTNPDPNANFTSDGSLPLLAVVSLSTGVANETSKAFWQHRMSYINKLAYCQRWGYDLIIDEIPSTELEGRQPVWGKIPFLRKLIHLKRYQWLMWMDMDAFFMRFDLPIHELITNDGDLILARDFNGINFGVFFLRSSPYSTELLSQMWSVPEQFWEPFQEQSALSALVGDYSKQKLEDSDPVKYNTTLHQQHIMYVRQRDMNSYGAWFAQGNRTAMWREGDRIVHFPGCELFPISKCEYVMGKFYEKMLNDSGTEDDGISDVPAQVYFSAHNIYNGTESHGIKLISDDMRY